MIIFQSSLYYLFRGYPQHILYLISNDFRHILCCPVDPYPTSSYYLIIGTDFHFYFQKFFSKCPWNLQLCQLTCIPILSKISIDL